MPRLHKLLLALVPLALYLAGPSFLSTHTLLLLALIATTSIITAGLSIVTGMTGQITLAQAAFSGLGAYGATILALNAGLPMWTTIPVAALIAAVIGFGVGLLSLRVEGHYLALVTLAFGGIVHLGLLHLEPLTGGAVGLPAESLTIAGFTFGSPNSLYYLCIGCAVLVFAAVSSMLRSRWGRAFSALRQSEMACQSLGIDVRRMKATAFALSAGLGALGGALQSLQTTYLDPGQFTILSGVSYLSVLVIGGLRSLSGAVIGAMIFVLTPELLGSFSAYMGLVFAAVLIGIILLAPAGLEDLVRRAPLFRRQGASR
jgi:branched-chain amino acid transport system permease protein